MEKLNVLDAFSGIGGFSKALDDAGYEIGRTFFSEIDKYAIANYRYNFPEAEYVGKIQDVKENLEASGINPYKKEKSGSEYLDIVTFGFPC